MKTVDFTIFKVINGCEIKEFFEEGLIHNQMEMLSIVDARKHYIRLYDDDPFFNHDPKDIEYRLDLYQKLETFSIGKIDFEKLSRSILCHSHGEKQPVWLHLDGAVTELNGNDFELPNDQGTNPVVAVFKSFTSDDIIKFGNIDHRTDWEKHIKESIQSKMIEIEAEHIK